MPSWERDGSAVSANGKRLAVAILLLLGAALYAIRARAVSEELRAGRDAYAALCARITESAAAPGSPGAIAHLLAAAQAELQSLAQRYPRWYAAYEKDPGSYACGPDAAGTPVGSDP
jgi:hypothetical protein